MRDSTTRDGSLEALVLPVDPATPGVAPVTRGCNEPQPLADSAAELDARDELAAGARWIGVAPPGEMPVRFRSHQLRSGASDTMRLDR